MMIYVTPSCCDAAKTHRSVYLTVDDEGNPCWQLLLAEIDRRQCDKPVWATELFAVPDPLFCPFCGTSLPQIEARANVTAPIGDDSAGDDHCKTCGERFTDCTCLPPWALYQPAGGDDLDVNALWQQNQEFLRLRKCFDADDADGEALGTDRNWNRSTKHPDPLFEIGASVRSKTTAGLNLMDTPYDDDFTVQTQPKARVVGVLCDSGIVRDRRPVVYRYEPQTRLPNTADIPTWQYLVECDGVVGWIGESALLTSASE